MSIRHVIRAALLALLTIPLPAFAVSAQPAEEGSGSAPPAASAPGRTPESLSDAEILIRARGMVEQDQERQRLFQERSQDLERAFESATELLARIDAERKRAASEPESGPAPDLVSLDEQWTSVLRQNDLLLRRRQAIDQGMRILDAKRKKLEETIEFLTFGNRDPAEHAADSGVAENPSASPGETTDGATIGEGFESAPGADRRFVRVYDRRVTDAMFELEERRRELRDAETRARLVKELTLLNQQDLTLTQVSAEASREHHEVLDAEAERQARDLERLAEVGAPEAQRRLLERSLRRTRALADRTASDAEQNAGIAAALEARLATLRELREVVLDGLEEAEDKVEAVQRIVEFQQSPLAPHRLRHWAIESGPRILAILVALLVFYVAMRRFVQHAVDGMVSRSRYGSPEERLERVETLRRVFRNMLTLVFVVIGALVLLPQFGIDAAVLLGGAAALSLAVAFGAQSLVADYFAGVMILLENQYRVGNVIQINDISGVVEDVSLRMTTLRDIEGVAHFIPHSSIQMVSNLTHGWSRVCLDVGVAYKENVDHVMEVLLDVAQTMRQDPEYRAHIMEDPEMLGVDAFGDSAVIIRLLVRTRPLKQWIVKRELLRRIKNRFDELGIEIPFPHRTVYHQDAGSVFRSESAAVRPIGGAGEAVSP